MSITLSQADGKSFSIPSNSLDIVLDYFNKVKSGRIPRPDCSCPKCQAFEEFKRHATRERTFYLIVDGIIRTVIGVLIRWKCPTCDGTFTYYPDFALPYKRYILPDILPLVTRYINDPKTSYRGLFGNQSFMNEESNKCMSHSTIYHWITFLGCLVDLLHNALSRILRVDPFSSVMTQIARIHISPRKFRSDERKHVLLRCLQFLYVNDIHLKMFGRSLFHRLCNQRHKAF